MSRLVHSPLESYELMHYAVEVSCFVCDGGNRHDAGRCRHCHAPLALTYQATARQAVKPQMLAILGPSGAGQTSYLGMLCDCLARQQEAVNAVFRGAFSVSLQQQVVASLVSQNFPASTSGTPELWHWNHVQITESRSRRVRELIFPDMPGAVMERELNDDTSPCTRALLNKCAGAVILLDTERIERGDPGPDFFAMKLLSYLGELGTSRNVAWRGKPVAFLFTKVDRSQACYDAPREYAETHAPGLFRQASSSLDRFKFFATSIAGATLNLEADGAPLSIPLRIEPRGISEPMTWLLKHLR